MGTATPLLNRAKLQRMANPPKAASWRLEYCIFIFSSYKSRKSHLERVERCRPLSLVCSPRLISRPSTVMTHPERYRVSRTRCMLAVLLSLFHKVGRVRAASKGNPRR